MLTQAQYNANAKALDGAISDARRAYDDAALDAITSESGDTSSLRKLQSDLEALKQHRGDLDAAWRAAATRRAAAADEDEARKRDEALVKVSAILDEAPKLALAAQQAAIHFWEIVADLRQIRGRASAVIRPHLLEHARETFDITKVFYEDDVTRVIDENEEALDFSGIIRYRTEKLKDQLARHIAARRRTREELAAEEEELIEDATAATEAV